MLSTLLHNVRHKQSQIQDNISARKCRADSIRSCLVEQDEKSRLEIAMNSYKCCKNGIYVSFGLHISLLFLKACLWPFLLPDLAISFDLSFALLVWTRENAHVTLLQLVGGSKGLRILWQVLWGSSSCQRCLFLLCGLGSYAHQHDCKDVILAFVLASRQYQEHRLDSYTGSLCFLFQHERHS